MIDHYLKYDTEAEAKLDLPYLLNEDGDWLKVAMFPINHEVDGETVILQEKIDVSVIPLFYEESGATEIVDGIESPIMQPIAGFFINLRCLYDIPELDTHDTHPISPERVWA